MLWQSKNLCDIEVTERCKYIRVVTNELARISDHYTNIAAAALELGALTAFIYFVEARETCMGSSGKSLRS